MQATYDTSGEAGSAGPFLAETEVIGFYRPEQAAAAARTSMTLVTDQSLGQWRQDDDEPARPMSDGTPPPGSQLMNKETADWYVKFTGGRLQAFLHAAGNWYLYAPKPAPVGVQPKVPTGQAAERDR